MIRRWYVIVLLCLLPVATTFAQDDKFDVLDDCGHDATALRAAIELDGWVFEDLIQFRWSPNCRYLAMRLPAIYGDPGTTIVWDAVINARVGILDSYAAGGVGGARWDPSGDYLSIAPNNVGTYLWHIPSNRPMLINALECGLWEEYWDYERGRIYATSPIVMNSNGCSVYIHVGGLRVYDLNTGATIATYSNTGYTLDYEFSTDKRYLILSSQLVEIWDQITGQSVAKVNVDTGTGVGHSSSHIELSPDGRYLAIGMNILRIWDLTTLHAELDQQQPTYSYDGPSERIREIRFIDNNTIETQTRTTTQRWDVTTGAELP